MSHYDEFRKETHVRAQVEQFSISLAISLSIVAITVSLVVGFAVAILWGRV